jgi:xylan 1,4-beta-xylosidase
VTFSNPVIPGFHPDPSVCRVGDEYFLVTSSFTYAPGVPIFRSRNLVDWTQIGNVLERRSQLDLSGSTGSASAGIYAPTLRHHDGRFWAITTCLDSSGFNSFFVTAREPTGPWSEPTRLAVFGIDPDLAWDAEGRCWVHMASGGRIVRHRIDDFTGAVLEGPEPTWSGTGLQYPEAPHLLERDGTWYLLIAEGGTERGHAVSVARGPSPHGPWEGCPRNPILSHRSTDSPIQNTGHADLVPAPDGTWWMVLLGVRPMGVSPKFHVLGRETFLTAVDWVDGWPVPADVALTTEGRPPGPPHLVEPLEPVARDDFDGPALAPQWISIRRYPTEVSSLSTRPGWLALAGDESTLDDAFPAFVGRRQQHHVCTVRTRVDAGAAAEAGMATVMDETAHYDVAVVGDRVIARARVGELSVVLGDAPRPPGPVVLTIGTGPHARGPDTVTLGFHDADGGRRTLAALDGRYLATEVTGGFLGRTVGMYAVGGDAFFDWFEYEGG